MSKKKKMKEIGENGRKYKKIRDGGNIHILPIRGERLAMGLIIVRFLKKNIFMVQKYLIKRKENSNN